MLPSLLPLLLCIQKGKHIIVRDKKIGTYGSEFVVVSLKCFLNVWVFFFFLYICLLKEPGCYVIISIAVMKVRVDIFHIH